LKLNGAPTAYLPPCSSYFNPIEIIWSLAKWENLCCDWSISASFFRIWWKKSSPECAGDAMDKLYRTSSEVQLDIWSSIRICKHQICKSSCSLKCGGSISSENN
jgi:hypothetical protein